MVRMAELLAERVQGMADGPTDQLTHVIRLALGRDPSASELKLLAKVAQEHGMPNACRLILNMNEFVFVD